MSSDIPAEPRMASPRARSWIVAAILLVLHWIVPGQFAFQPAFDGFGSDTVMAADARATPPGTLPRAQSQTATVEAGLPKAPLQRTNAGGKPSLLPTGQPEPLASPPVRVRSEVANTGLPPAARRSFNPRAPPQAMA